MILVTQTLPTVLSWSVDPQQAGIAELLEHFLAGEYLLLLPGLPVLVDDLIQHPPGGLLQGQLLAVVEVGAESRGVEATAGLECPHRPQQSSWSHPLTD